MLSGKQYSTNTETKNKFYIFRGTAVGCASFLVNCYGAWRNHFSCLTITVNTTDHGGGRGTMEGELISTMETGRGTSEGELECFVQLSLVNKHNI